MKIWILCIAEIVGKAGIACIKPGIKQLEKDRNIELDFIMGNGDGTTGGFGLGKNHSIVLHKKGLDAVTGGECLFYKKDMVPHLTKASYMIRPANYPPGVPGRGWRIFRKEQFSLGVVSMLGLSGYNRTHLNNPYTYFPEIVKRIKETTPLIILDYHATTTAEKGTMGFLADGQATAVIGTGFKVQTADETILPKGTAYITDSGRTGSFHSVGGLSPEIEIQKFRTQIPERSMETMEKPELQGVLLQADTETGKALSIERIKIPCEVNTDEGKSNHNRDKK